MRVFNFWKAGFCTIFVTHKRHSVKIATIKYQIDLGLKFSNLLTFFVMLDLTKHIFYLFKACNLEHWFMNFFFDMAVSGAHWKKWFEKLCPEWFWILESISKIDQQCCIDIFAFISFNYTLAHELRPNPSFNKKNFQNGKACSLEPFFATKKQN